MELIDIYKKILCNKSLQLKYISDVQFNNLKDFNQWNLQHFNILEENISYYMDLYNPKHKFLNVYEILNQYVQDPELTPVPKQLLNKIIKDIIINKQQVYSISYNEIYKLLIKYDYEYFEQFKNILQKYGMFNNGYLYIAYISLDYSQNFSQNQTLNRLTTDLNNYQKACSIFSELINNKNVSALTTQTEELENSTFIFLNYQKTKSYLIDSIEHQLTHFVQRIVGLDKSLSKFISKNYTSAEIKQNIQSKIINYLKTLTTDQNKIYNLLQFARYFLSLREIHQTQKRILSGFQRAYQKDIKYVVRDSLNNRKIWLNKFLKNINDSKINLDFKLDSLTFKEQLPIIIFMYKLVNEIFPNENIDKRLLNHFQKFDFKF